MFPMTVTLSNTAQLNAVIAALATAGVEPPKPADVQFAKSPAEAVAKQTAVQAAPKAAPAPAPAEAAAAPTYEDVKKLVLLLSSEKGREPTVALLGTFGVAKAPDLKPEQYADAIAAFTKALAG